MAYITLLSVLVLISTILCAGVESNKKEVHEFKAETAKLMDIIINSLYSTRDVFLRELISNSADALEKARIESLGHRELLGNDVEESELRIKIWADKEKREIYIQDTGIGMSREELINNLGTIAESGTKRFFDEMAEAQKLGENSAETAANLIGQFGVGFFSAFLVADYVVVDSVKMKNSVDEKEHEAYRWTSDSKAGFTVSKSPEGMTEMIKRGTLITLHIRPNDGNEDGSENSESVNYYYDFDGLFEGETLKKLIEEYSGYIEYPILYKEEVDVEYEEEVCTEEEKEEEGGENENEEKEKKLVKECHMEKKTRKELQFRRVNSTKVIWMKDPSEITNEEYIEFYKEYLTRGKITTDPAGWIHYKSVIYADAIAGPGNAKSARDVSFTVLVFLPRDNALRFRPDSDPLNNGFKLHVNRVYVTDDLKDVIPSYLDFCYGVIDISDVGGGSGSTINLSREMLQNNKVLELIGKNVTKKILEKMNELHNEDIEKYRQYEEDGNGEEKSQPEFKYFEMYAKYTDKIKAGIIEDKRNANKVAKLLRFVSSKSLKIHPDTLEKIDKVSYSHGYDKVVRRMRTLDEYVESKLEGQEYIYYLGCRDVEECMNSPLAEYALKHGFEVFYLYEPYDTFTLKNLGEYRGLKFADLMAPRLKFPGAIKTDEEIERDAEDVDNDQIFKQTIKRIRSVLSGRLNIVTLSKRLVDSPAAVVSKAGSPTATEIRILESQFLAESRMFDKREDQRILEINPYNKLIIALKDAIEKDVEEETETQAINELIVLLYEAASIESGYITEDAVSSIIPKIHQAMNGIDLTIGWDEAMEEVERIRAEREEKRRKEMEEKEERERRKREEEEEEERLKKEPLEEEKEKSEDIQEDEPVIEVVEEVVVPEKEDDDVVDL